MHSGLGEKKRVQQRTSTCGCSRGGSLTASYPPGRTEGTLASAALVEALPLAPLAHRVQSIRGDTAFKPLPLGVSRSLLGFPSPRHTALKREVAPWYEDALMRLYNFIFVGLYISWVAQSCGDRTSALGIRTCSREVINVCCASTAADDFTADGDLKKSLPPLSIASHVTFITSRGALRLF